MTKSGRGQTRRDSKRRILRPGESVRADGRYQYKYYVDGKAHFLYSWRLEQADKLPSGKKLCKALREMEKQVNSDLEVFTNFTDGTMTVCELVDRCIEPWFGRCDSEAFEGQLEDREYSNMLIPGQSFDTEYIMTFS